MIVLYSTPTCPNCDIVKNKLKENNIEYELNQNIEEMKKIGIKSVPVLKIGDELLTFKDIIKKIDKLKTSKKDARRLMSDAKYYESYGRYDDNKARYEVWDESVQRVMDMHREYFKDEIIISSELDDLINEVEQGYKDKLFLGSQRALQFGGEQLLKNHAKLYNCAASYCDRPNFFGGYFFLLMSGCGVGFSVQKHHIDKLPTVSKRNKSAKTYVVPDSIEGWANTIDVLLSSYFDEGQVYPEYSKRKIYFDLSQIRPKGSFISGGFKAPGAEPLRRALDAIELLIERELNNGNNKLKPIVVYDICMYIADAVISGGK